MDNSCPRRAALHAGLDQLEIEWEASPDGVVIFTWPSATLECHTAIDVADPEDHFVPIHHRFPLRVPEERRARLAEFACRLNAGITRGVLAFDWDGGALLFRTHVNTRPHTLDWEVFAGEFFASLHFADKLARILPDLVVRGGPADTAIEQLEALLKEDAHAKPSDPRN